MPRKNWRMKMAIDKDLLDILACPKCNIPVMLIDEAQKLEVSSKVEA